VGEQALECGLGGRVQRCWVGTAGHAYQAGAQVEIVGAQVTQLGDRGAVQQQQQPGGRLAWVQPGCLGGPAVIERPLLGDGEHTAGEGEVGVGAQVPGGVGKDRLGRAGVAEERPQPGKLSSAVGGPQGGQERLDVAGADLFPAADLGPVRGQEPRQIPDRDQVDLQGALGAGFGARTAGSLLVGLLGGVEPGRQRAKRLGDLGQPPHPPSLGRLGGLVAAQQQTGLDQERLQHAAQRSGGRSGGADGLEHGRRRAGGSGLQQGAKMSQQRDRAVAGAPLGQEHGEVAKPGGRGGQPIGQALGVGAGAGGVTLVAAAAATPGAVRAQLAAVPADPQGWGAVRAWACALLAAVTTVGGWPDGPGLAAPGT
jgi:hypothetical protein